MATKTGGGGSWGGSVKGASTSSNFVTRDSRNAYSGNIVRPPIQQPTYQPAMQQQPQNPGINFNNAPMQSAPQQAQIDFDALIAPAIQGLEAAIGPLNESYGANVQGINANKESLLSKNAQSVKDQQGQLTLAGQNQSKLSQSAADQARQQFAEIQQGIQSRYGGTTGTGAFASELAGRQTQQNIGTVNQGLADALFQVDQKKQQVQAIGDAAVKDIENQTQAQLSSAKANLDTAIASIRNQQGMLQAQKAQMAAQAIQHYQDTVNQVNANNQSFKQQLYAQQISVQQQLEAAAQRGSGIAGSFQATTPTVNDPNLFSPQDMANVQNGSAVVGGGTGAGNFNAAGATDFYSQLQKQLGLQGGMGGVGTGF